MNLWYTNQCTVALYIRVDYYQKYVFSWWMYTVYCRQTFKFYLHNLVRRNKVWIQLGHYNPQPPPPVRNILPCNANNPDHNSSGLPKTHLKAHPVLNSLIDLCPPDCVGQVCMSESARLPWSHWAILQAEDDITT